MARKYKTNVKNGDLVSKHNGILKHSSLRWREELAYRLDEMARKGYYSKAVEGNNGEVKIYTIPLNIQQKGALYREADKLRLMNNPLPTIPDFRSENYNKFLGID